MGGQRLNKSFSDIEKQAEERLEKQKEGESGENLQCIHGCSNLDTHYIALYSAHFGCTIIMHAYIFLGPISSFHQYSPVFSSGNKFVVCYCTSGNYKCHTLPTDYFHH